MVTRGQASYRGDGVITLAVPKPCKFWKNIDRDELARLQREDASIKKYKSKYRPMLKEDQEVVFEEKDNVITEYRSIPRWIGERENTAGHCS